MSSSVCKSKLRLNFCDVPTLASSALRERVPLRRNSLIPIQSSVKLVSQVEQNSSLEEAIQALEELFYSESVSDATKVFSLKNKVIILVQRRKF